MSRPTPSFFLKITTRSIRRITIARGLRYNVPSMRVLLLSKACIVGQYQTKLTTLAAMPGVDLTVVVPPGWRDERGMMPLERKHLEGYQLCVAPIRFNGHFHIHYYPTLPEILAQVQPEILHLDEEPYNFATFHAATAIRHINPNTRILFFSWQNLDRRYPPPFSWMEQSVYKHANAAIAGSQDAELILRRKGFHKEISVIPQFGVPDSFAPAPTNRPARAVTIGYAGRLVREKGVQVLLRALAQVSGDWQLKILGSGPLFRPLERQVADLKLSARVQFAPWVASDQMPTFFNSLDLLVVPSLTQANWQEQFGRVIMEAMACGVPVIGSDSGEIPNVLGDAGIIVPEGDPSALARAIDDLIRDSARRRALGALGRARVLALYSQQRVVENTFALYKHLI